MSTARPLAPQDIETQTIAKVSKLHISRVTHLINIYLLTN